MKIKHVRTFKAEIYLGLKEGYGGKYVPKQVIVKWLQDYCDKNGFAVTITDTKFIYTDGNEKGIVIGMINYPRFPSKEHDITIKALHIAKELLNVAKQERCSVVCRDNTYLIEKEKETEDDKA